MSPEPRTISVHILGQEYRIRSTEDGEFVRQVAGYVDELMHRISSSMTAPTKTRVAVLAALNIAEELFRERKNGAGIDAESLEPRLRALIERVDEIVVAEEGERRTASRPSGPSS